MALDSDASDRLDLAWYGVWMLAGLTLVLILSPTFVRGFRFFRP